MGAVRLTLYIAGQTPRSQRALANLRRLGEDQLAGSYDLSVVDVTEDPEAAEAARILTTPTVVRESPAPVRRVTGDLADLERVLFGLGLDMAGTPEPEMR